MTTTVRPARAQDLPGMVRILNHYIQHTAINFDTDTYTPEQRQTWFDQFSDPGRYRCLVAERFDRIVGYANSSALRPKAAYDTSVEVSVYTDSAHTKQGLGSRLYEALFKALADEDIHRAHAVITLPNDGSVRLHEKFGFYEVGVLHEAGRKFGQYHSVYWMEKRLN